MCVCACVCVCVRVCVRACVCVSRAHIVQTHLYTRACVYVKICWTISHVHFIKLLKKMSYEENT